MGRRGPELQLRASHILGVDGQKHGASRECAAGLDDGELSQCVACVHGVEAALFLAEFVLVVEPDDRSWVCTVDVGEELAFDYGLVLRCPACVCMHVYVCVCVCAYIYIYIYICVCEYL